MPQIMIAELEPTIDSLSGYEVKSFGDSAGLPHPVPSRTIVFRVDIQSGMQALEVDESDPIDNQSVVAAVKRVRAQPAREWVDFDLA